MSNILAILMLNVTTSRPVPLVLLAVTFRIGFEVIYLIMVASFVLFLAMCLETYGVRTREMQTLEFSEKMNLRARSEEKQQYRRRFYMSRPDVIKTSAELCRKCSSCSA